jgi:TnsA endonuclease N terminal/TnsA endonuclease C terminal
MGRYRAPITVEWIAAQIKVGRGAGVGQNYKPWLTVRSFPSRGRVHRIWGYKTNRVHHLLSDLERNIFLHFLWPRSVIDIREQFPLLPFEESVEIAREIGVRHPVDPRTKHPIVMSTDLLLTVEQRLKDTSHPYTVKYLQDLQNSRTKEKLEIERRYWAAPHRNLKLKILTEQHVSLEFVKNMLWALPFYEVIALYPLNGTELNRAASALTQLVLHEDISLRVVAQKCDRLLHLETGTSLAVVRHLIARRYWEVDMHKRIRTSERLTLLHLPETILYSGRLVA